MYPIAEPDVVYEQAIIRDPLDIRSWLRYIEFKAESSIAERAFVLQRACFSLPRSYKLWKMYLDLRVEQLHAFIKRHPHVEYSHPTVKQATETIASLYDRALVLLNKMPRLWTDYLEFLLETRPRDITTTRKQFDRALQSLPATQHSRIWPLFMKFASEANPRTKSSIWLRYVKFAPDQIEDCIDVQLEVSDNQSAADLLISILNNPRFVSSKGKSRFQLLEDLIEILVHHSHQLTGIDSEAAIRSAMDQYADQKGKLCVQLALYWINRKQFDKARDVFEKGLVSAGTVRDFSQVFDSYTEFEESLIAQQMESNDADSAELDRMLEAFEQLMDRRPFLVNDVLLRQDSNNVTEWEKRVGLWGGNVTEVVNTYEKAIETIVPKKANGKLHQLWVNYAKFYEAGGDISTARVIFDKATKVPYKTVNELADLWIEWSEMELRAENFDNAVRVMETATRGPKVSRVDFFDESKPPQERVHKSMKLWSFYVDLVESVGSLDEVKPLYDRIFELKIGTTLTIVNYANLMEENNYFEEAFRIYERGVDLFSYPIAFEIWNIYLQKAVRRNLGIERLRDLFEQALEECPPNLCKSLYILYGKLEEERGLVRNAIKIYSRAAKAVDDKSRLEMYQFYIARVAENFGLPGTRPIFQDAIDNLGDRDANIVCLEFIEVEEKLGEIDRARALYGYTSQFNDPRTSEQFWSKWEKFEVKYGSEDTYKEMLRIKRSVVAQYNTDTNYLAATAKSANETDTGIDSALNAPIGFVTSEQQRQQRAKEAARPQDTSNPDAIDLDM